MTRAQLVEQIRNKQSYLCIGLDTDITKIPQHLLKEPDPVFAFNKAIIDATQHLCVSYKINTAFYEALGLEGWQSMQRTLNHIPHNIFTIADAKRGDIGNTADQYAKAFFTTMPFDAITVAPYMGEDSVKPFLQYEEKWAIVLGLTSNKGAGDFELQDMVVREDTNQGDTNHGNADQGDRNRPGGKGVEKLYEKVLRTASGWGNTGNTMFVIGATHADEFVNIRKILPDHFFLVPGVGAQGGSLQEISAKARNKDIGLLVNVSRAVIYASDKEDFAAKARTVAQAYQLEMKSYLNG